MWFGTQDGFNRFDGKNFTHIIPVFSKGKTTYDPGKLSKMITALYADKNDWLWVGTTYEIVIYDRYLNKFIHPESIYPGLKLPKGIWVNKVLEDQNDNIWILTQQNGLFGYNKKTKTTNAIEQSTVSLNEIRTINMSPDGIVYVATEKAVYKINGGRFDPVLLKDPKRSKEVIIKDICSVKNQLWVLLNTSEILILTRGSEDGYSSDYFTKTYKGARLLTDARLIHASDSNTVWIGSRREGLLKVNIREKTFENADAQGTISSLKTPFILSFYTDNQKITWIGLSGGGIAKYDLQKIQFGLWRNDPVEHEPVPDNMFLSLFSENDQDFYIGTLTGGLLHLNTLSRVSHYYMPPALSKAKGLENIYTIIKGENNLLWMASEAGLLSFDTKTKSFKHYFDPNDKQTIKLTSILKLKNQNKILAGGYEGSLRLFDLGTKKWEKCPDQENFLRGDSLKMRVRHMEEQDNGDIYMSTEAYSLVCYNYLTGKFTFYPQFQKVSGGSRHFCIDDKYLWIATDDGLIQALMDSKKVIKIWTTENGLPNNYIYVVTTDKFDNIWISTNYGLAMLDYNKAICKKFTEDDGLQSMEFNTACYHKDRKGNLWFGGIKGMNKVTPGFTSPSDYSPPPLITGINVMNSPLLSDTVVTYLSSFSLPYSKNFVSFEFQSPNYSQSDNIIYQYKLIGVDTGWINNGTRNYVNYTQLKPGKYVFHVRSANTNFIWSDDATKISFNISPPWYNTWWFYTLLIIVGTTAVYLFINQRIQNLKIKMEAKQKITETEMAALKAQMNPHFMFNCINSIDAFIYNNDKYNATLYLNKFAKLLRNVLESSKQNLVLFSKDIETLKIYIELEQLRSENKFTTVFDIDKELLNSDYKVPPLIIQPFVENAIIHGLRNKETNDGILAISVKETADHLEYTITDNGVGRNASSRQPSFDKTSYGIQITTDRIRYFNNESKASFNISDLYEGREATGTKITVTLKKS